MYSNNKSLIFRIIFSNAKKKKNLTQVTKEASWVLYVLQSWDITTLVILVGDSVTGP